MSLRRTLGLLALLAAAASVGASCFIEGFVLVETAAAGGVPDAGPDGSGGAGGAEPTCQHATWPAPPAEPDPGTNSEDFVAAVRAVDFGENEGGASASVGYDLDTRCTCQGEGSSCNEPSWATADHCDGVAGRDNASGRLFGEIALFADNLTSEFNSAEAEAGQWSLLIRVRDYNGLANDDRVTLSIYPSPGLDKDPCLGANPVPAWDGTDRWPISAESLNGYGVGGGSAGGGGAGAGSGTGGCTGVGGASPWDVDDARYTDPNAYVTDWTVVANLPEAGMVLATSGSVTDLRITAGFVTARIERTADDSGWQLRDGQFVGRWRVTDFFSMLASIENSGSPMCTDHPVYQIIKNAVCRYPDIASTLSGPTTPCDSLSFAMGLRADPAQLGAVWVTAAQPTTCAPGTDPAEDTCEP